MKQTNAANAVSGEKREIAKQIALVFLAALSLRLIFLVLTLQAHSSDQIMVLFPDSRHYVTVGSYLLGWNGTGEEALLLTGPGYGAFLASWFLLFGYTALPILISQILISSLACVLIFLIARAILPEHTIAPAIAGIIAAISLTSISLSCSILSDSLFFDIQVLSMLCLILGVQQDRWGWFATSGILGGVGALVRASSQFLPLVIVLVVLIVPQRLMSHLKKNLIVKALVAGVIAGIIIFSWSWRNYATDGVFTLAEIGTYTARNFWAAAALSPTNPVSDIERVRQEMQNQELERYGSNETLADKHAEDVRIVVDALQKYPVRMLQTFVVAAITNVVLESDDFHNHLLPQLGSIWTRLNLPFLAAGVSIFVLSCAGAIMLWRASPSVGLALMLATYAYYAVMSGFTFWQGSRIFFPAQMTWAILVAWCLTEGITRIRKLASR